MFVPLYSWWGCDLLTKTDQHGHRHLAIAIVDHASRACLRLQRLSDKSSLTLVRELIEVVTRYGSPQFVRTDNEAVFVSRLFRLGLWLLGIRQQRIEPGCPWQNGRIERFIGTVKRELRLEVLTSGQELDRSLTDIRQWYNHERPHDHLHGRTPAEVWPGLMCLRRSPVNAESQRRGTTQQQTLSARIQDASARTAVEEEYPKEKSEDILFGRNKRQGTRRR